MPEISVIIPVYNVEKYLRECLDSIVNQSFFDIEIICINDGSTDCSLDILKEYEKQDSRVKVFDRKHNGPSAARNIGINESKGKYITFVDADDYIEKDTYETAIKYIKNVDLVAWGIKVFGEHLLKQRKSDNEYYQLKYNGLTDITDKVVLDTDCSVCNKLFKKEILQQNNISFPEGLHYEDALFWWKYSVNSKNLYFIDSYFYNYRRRDDSIMANTFAECDYAVDHLYIADDFYAYLKDKNILEKEISLFISIFKSGFYFAYSYSPDDKLPAILEKAATAALRYFENINVKNRFVSALLKKDFERIFEPELSFWETLFCIKNLPVKDNDYKYKLISILGMKFKIRINRQ